MSTRPLLIFRDSIVPYTGANSFRAAINSVVDGDTVWVERDTGCRDTQLIELRVTGRMWRGFNAAERFTPEGRAMSALVRDWCPIKSVIMIETQPDTEKYGRWLSPLLVPITGGLDLAAIVDEDTIEINAIAYVDLAAHLVRHFPEGAKWQEY